MSSGCSLWTAIVTFGAAAASMGALSCSTSDRPPYAEDRVGLGCGRGVQPCDIQAAACRQDVLDAVACLRDYEEPVEQPTVHFIRLSDLAEAPSSEDEFEEDELRLGYSLFGLVSPAEVDGEAAEAAQLDNIGALYSSEDKAVYVLTDPGGEELSESELGVSAQAYLMSLLAHEYVHFLQDREFDLEEFADQLSERFDPMLAGISAVEGEATLYEALFSYAVAGVPATDERILGQFERYVDFSEDAIREAASPALEARMLFPYTYGAHSSAVLHIDDGIEALGDLRRANSTLEFIQRRWGKVERVVNSVEADDLQLEEEGFQKLGDEQFGPWVLNAFWSRTLGSSTNEALDVAQRWQDDRLSVWRNPETGETVGSWAIQFDTFGPDVSSLARALAEANPRAGTAWAVRVSGDHCLVIASSTDPRSAVVSQWGALPSTSPQTSDAGAEPDPLVDQLSSAEEDAGYSAAGSTFRADHSSKQLTSKSPPDHGMRLPEAAMWTHRLRAQQRLEQFVRQRRSRLW